MLVWEEEAKPSTIHTANLSQNHATPAFADAAASMFPEAASIEAPAEVPAVARRVKAADKRIINGRTDVTAAR